MKKPIFIGRWPRAIGSVLVFAWLIGISWTLAAGQADQTAEVFSLRVKPIFERNCVGCHGGTIQRVGLDLRSQESVLRGGSRGPAIIPGKPDQSTLYRVITHTDAPAMPMGKPKLADSDIAVIAQWIGSLPASVAVVVPEAAVPVRQPGLEITNKDRHFWSFVKPVRPAVPATANRSWIRGDIDAFILRRLEENGLTPSPAAEPRTLIRRVYLDLIGLPPSPEEVDSFVRNPSDAAYEKVIDELLASPHYGERWGRHWLDLARYADSGGYEFDYDRPNAWRYRDYVIKSFNDDKPYLQFVREQLAGDQLKPGDPQFLVPTGFCRSGPTVDNADNEETRMDELDDMVTTTSSVFLGLTVGCARCHDHKYDPIPQKDYYRMQAIFSPFKKTDQSLLSPADEAAFKASAKALEEDLKPLRQKVGVIEKPHREKLLADKVEFHLKLAQSTGSLEGQNREEFRKALVERFAKDVKLQPEEIEALLSPEEKQARRSLLNEIERIDKLRSKPLPAAMGITDDQKAGKTFLLERGNHRTKGVEVQPGLPSVLAGGTDLNPRDRRRQLADWIATADNPLTARVVANRIWQYHFGKGIVRTPSDFGATGDRPSHPELLDWLATEMIARGWSWKAMHRLIVTSNTYRQSSRFDSKAAASDPENRLLWRMSPRRVETEVVRDSILTLSGKLNREMGGAGVYPRIDPSVIATGSRPKWPLDVREGPGEWRRSVYIVVKRSVLVPLIEVFDCPVTTVSAPSRPVSTVSPQALALMNNEFVLEQSRYFADRIKREAGVDTSAQIVRGFQIALNRNPNAKERTWASEFLKSQARGYLERKNDDPDGSARRDFCHALINLNEFLYVD
jgi:mono/diheme cytochrome c family protein